MNYDIKSVVVGNEFDDALRDSIRIVLDRIGAVCVDRSWGVGGSQECDKFVFNVGEDKITLELETYVGITISGPNFLVEEIVRGLSVNN